MVQSLRKDSVLAATTLGLGLVLSLLGMGLVDQGMSAAQHGQRMRLDHLVAITASTVGLAIVVWWAMSFAVALLAAGLAASGRSQRVRSVAKFSPAFMVRLACAIVSLNFLGAGVAHAGSAVPDPGWHVPNSGAAGSSEGKASPLAERIPSSVKKEGVVPAGSIDPRWQPMPPVVEPGPISRPQLRQSPGPAAALLPDDGIAVRPGDSLWSIAAARLGPLATDVDIALSWPAWYEANRDIIGEDPTALQPGQVLRPPEPG
ncbi:LysM peptidoglycan-binding domain-containing protein [Paenarthrobacter ilicis]|uniref:LysM peptidoglycan-binding domain-containing protein n=1 Tax=Paenarthrobacter ilicis TaxID=43665 RepID=UPI00300A57EB